MFLFLFLLQHIFTLVIPNQLKATQSNELQMAFFFFLQFSNDCIFFPMKATGGVLSVWLGIDLFKSNLMLIFSLSFWSLVQLRERPPLGYF